jgi:hypothetical protein
MRNSVIMKWHLVATIHVNHDIHLYLRKKVVET